ncbi:MAG: adenylate/guanylate cyclase domain-containing protein [Chlamydiota bacterium]
MGSGREKSSLLLRVVMRFLNPMLIAVIAVGSFALLRAYFMEMEQFIYTSPAQRHLDTVISYIYLAISFVIYFLVCLVYEKPIHRALGMIERKQDFPDALLHLARLRAMNVSLVYAGMTAFIWVLAMMLFPFILSMLSPPVLRSYWLTGFLLSFFVGAFILALVYFTVTEVSGWRFLPKLFPLGHLDSEVGGHSLTVRSTLHLVFGVICALPLLLNAYNMLIWRYVILVEAGDRAFTATRMAEYIVSQSGYLSLFSFIMGLAIVFCVGLGMRQHLRLISEAVEAVHRGDLSTHARVSSRDEMGMLADRVNEMIIGLRERKRIVEAFNRYVDRTLTQQVLNGDLKMGGIQLEVSIIFCDIRGYTTLSEGMDPDRVVAMLNRYFTRMAEAIEENGGSINKFIGDAILAIFGTPQPLPDHRDHAIRAALAMCRALEEFNAEQREDGQQEISIGIGIHSGVVLAGNIGTPNKIEFTVIGDPVNVAQRIEELTVERSIPIICSGATLGPYKNRYPHEQIDIVQLKGRSDVVDIYALKPPDAKPDGKGGGSNLRP